jgi:hypothetical protein
MVRAMRFLIVLALLASAAHAQPLSAVAQPLPDGSMPVGNVVVRVVAGDPFSPAVGVVVTLATDGGKKTRTEKTDASGRATFVNVVPQTSVTVSVPSAAPTLARSTFLTPASGGVRLFLSTAPWKPRSMLPSPRETSGKVMPDSNTPAGTLEVRLSYDDRADPKPPANVGVTLVGYAADGKVSVQTAVSGANGRATFTKLDTSQLTAYFAFTTLPRGGKLDRMVSEAFVPTSTAGLQVMLSGASRTSTGPAIDVEGGLVAKDRVRVELEGTPDPAAAIEVVDAATGKVLAKAPVKPGDKHVELAIKSSGVLYAQTTARGESYRSQPMLAVADRGMRLEIDVVPRLASRFDLVGAFENNVLAVQVKLELRNNSWLPVPPVNVEIPFAAGFSGGVLSEWSEDLAKLTKRGVQITTALPPGGVSVTAGYTLPVKNGKAQVSIDLPAGTIDSRIRIVNDPGVALDLPPGAGLPVSDGLYLTVDNIAIAAKKSIAFAVTAPKIDPKQVAIAKTCEALRPERRSTRVGQAAPDFTAPLLAGKSFTLSSLRGKQVIVTFNASWNSMRQDLSTLPKLAVGNTTEIVVVLSDKDPAEIAQAFGAIPFRVALDPPADPDGVIGPITGSWGIHALPETFVVDAKGIVRGHFVSHRDWSIKEAPACLRALN